MAADNHTTIVGNLVDDPELRFTNSGIAVANLHVAVTQRIQQGGEWRDGETSFLKVNVWRGQAEHLADSLAKSDRRSECLRVTVNDRHYSCFADAHGTELVWPMDATVAHPGLAGVAQRGCYRGFAPSGFIGSR